MDIVQRTKYTTDKLAELTNQLVEQGIDAETIVVCTVASAAVYAVQYRAEKAFIQAIDTCKEDLYAEIAERDGVVERRT